MFANPDVDVVAAPTHEFWKSSSLLFHKIRPFVLAADLSKISGVQTQRKSLSELFREIPDEVLDDASSHLMSVASSIDGIALSYGTRGPGFLKIPRNSARATGLVAISDMQFSRASGLSRRARRDASRLWMITYQDLWLPISNRLAWEQVIEFRRDKLSVYKYRRFRTWILDFLSARVAGNHTEMFEERIDEYRLSLKKHGIQTARGAVEIAFEREKLTRASVGLDGSLENLQCAIDTLAAGMKIGAEASVYLGNSTVEFAGTTESETVREIAILYDMDRSEVRPGLTS